MVAIQVHWCYIAPRLGETIFPADERNMTLETGNKTGVVQKCTEYQSGRRSSSRSDI